VRSARGCPGRGAADVAARERAQKAEHQLKARLEESAKQTSEQLHEAERRLKAQLRSGAVATSTQLARRVERLQRLESSLRAGPVVDRALARHLSSLATAQVPRPAAPGMRKVRSENDFQALQRGGGGGGGGSSGGEAQPGLPFAPRSRGRPRLRGHDWDVFAALNGALLRGGRVPADGPARPPSAGLARAASAGLARAPSAAPLAPSRAAPSLQDQARAWSLLRPPALAFAVPALVSAGRRTCESCRQGAACRQTEQRGGHEVMERNLHAMPSARQGVVLDGKAEALRLFARAQLRAGPGGEAARALWAAPQRTLRTCQRTLENCSENLQTLGQLLQQSAAASQFAAAGASRRIGAAAAARIPPPAAAQPRAPPGSHNTAFVACQEAVVSPGFPSLQARPGLRARVWQACLRSYRAAAERVTACMAAWLPSLAAGLIGCTRGRCSCSPAVALRHAGRARTP